VSALQPLRSDHAQSVLAFELANRAYFARFVSDRGDDYFHDFTERYDALLAEQATGIGAYYLLVADDGSVMGRFNLRLTGDGVAELGYRVAQNVAGRGVATAAVLDLCQVAAEQHGVHTVRAAAAQVNVASQRVLLKAGFVPVGPADPAAIGGKPGTWYQRRLPAGADR
jgi:[ribosomal protein S5]-alanine N-acetyltransferase